jgi:hypothetical protein
MDSKIVRRKKPYKGLPGCFTLYRLFVWIGSKFYLISEKCVWYSRDRQRKIEADEAWEKKMAVGEMILDNEEFADKMLKTDEIEVSCQKTVEELGATYLELKQQLEFCNNIVYRLWQAHCDNNSEVMQEIFNEIGLKEKK